MSDPERPSDDDQLFAELAAFWRAADPVPDDLDDSVLTLIDAALIVDEAEVLMLISDEGRLAGVRSATDARTLRFEAGPCELLLHIVAEPDRGGALVRIDGWVAPGTVGSVILRHAAERRPETTRTVSTDDTGRFAFAGVGPGVVSLRFVPDAASTALAAPDAASTTLAAPDGGQRTPSPLGWATPDFTL